MAMPKLPRVLFLLLKDVDVLYVDLSRAVEVVLVEQEHRVIDVVLIHPTRVHQHVS